MPCYSFQALTPVVDPTAFVHPTAVLLGDVLIGPGCYVGANAVLRGDFGRLMLMAGANLQDTCVMHSFPGCDTVVEEDGHIGHGAVLHGCHIGRNAMVGMNAVVMDNVVVGEESIVAALAFVRADTRIPPRSLVAGLPAKVLREVTEQELAWKTKGTRIYQQLAWQSLATLTAVEPLTVPEANRGRHAHIDGFDPLFKMKQHPGN